MQCFLKEMNLEIYIAFGKRLAYTKENEKQEEAKMQTLEALLNRAVGGESRNAFCRRAGISAGNFSRILKGQKASPEVLRKVAAASPAVGYGELLEAAGYAPPAAQAAPQGIPIYGSIAAGSPIEAEEDLSGYVYLDYAQKQFGADCFALRVVGDSMDMANMPDGSTVIVRRQSDVRDGEIGAVLIAGQATVKKVYHKGRHLVLSPVSKNPAFAPQLYSEEEDVRILGKVVLSLVEIS